ncbi:hypothetical protein [Curtobacterium flaccumfaciens]|uniref:hypothetical protein n=1 Tax=Curtobacterium flaccumfaciens TaxID=2035 RepID=UPI002659571A|nr:hypothetical protein [Curtobacterium flaccumfaciens]MCX2844165.1 hypothetical protein [Curtobacterium flaccumfaciens pv. oortii]
MPQKPIGIHEVKFPHANSRERVSRRAADGTGADKGYRLLRQLTERPVASELGSAKFVRLGMNREWDDTVSFDQPSREFWHARCPQFRRNIFVAHNEQS